VDVEKGIAEAQLVKKKHLEELKEYQSSDPQWLLELKQQDEQAALEEAARKKMELEEDEKVTEEEESLNEKADAPLNEKPATTKLRQR
jgi:hypothetical protein